MYRYFPVLVFFLMSSGAAQAASCRANWHFNLGQASSGSMAATSGVPCNADIDRSSGSLVIKTIRIASPPTSGSASAHSTGVTYRSKPGFKGSDAFTFTILGDGRSGQNQTATVQMTVDVQQGGTVGHHGRHDPRLQT